MHHMAEKFSFLTEGTKFYSFFMLVMSVSFSNLPSSKIIPDIHCRNVINKNNSFTNSSDISVTCLLNSPLTF